MNTLHPLLDREKQTQAKQYEREKRLFGLAESGISLLFISVFYFSGFSQWLAHLNSAGSVIGAFFYYVSVFAILSTIIGLPLNFYVGYIHEHRWEFSNHSLKSWWLDQLKSLLVGMVLTIILLGMLFWVMTVVPDYWWLVAGLSVAVVSVILATLVPIIILPIFNKYTPIEAGELTDRLDKILRQVGLKPSGFFMEDMSKQTKKENAFLAGLGRTRRVVLADNLIENMSIPEIESVIAHEVGHYKYRHIWKQITIGTIQQLIIFFLIDQIMRFLFPDFLSGTRWNLTLFPVFTLLISLFSGFIFGPSGNALSRYFERQADRTALEIISEPTHFLSAMAGLANRNLSNAYPNRWIKWLYYSHPPIGERLEMGEAWRR